MYDRKTTDKILVTVPIVLLLVLLFFSGWVRLYNITNQGMMPGDGYSYLNEAKLWADGKTPTFLKGWFYRPVLYFLQGMAIKFFGYTDYSVKILNCIMDLFSIILIFLIASRLAGNRWVGLSGSLLYAFLNVVIYFSRYEMPQPVSTFFVMLAFYFFILFDNRGKKGFKTYLLLFLAGFSSGLAANTHPDLAFLGPGYVLYLLIKQFDLKNKRDSIKTFLIQAAIFTFSFFLPYGLGFILFGFKRVLQVFFNEFLLANKNMPGKYGKMPGPLIFLSVLLAVIRYPFASRYLIFALLITGAILIILYRRIKKEDDSLSAYLPLILLSGYALFYASLIDTFNPSLGRILIPLIPLVIFILTYWYYKFFQQLLGKYALVFFICFSLGLFFLSPKAMFKTVKYYKAPQRTVYDALKDKVDEKNKVLLAPALLSFFDYSYRCDLYLGKNALYMVQLPIKDEYNATILRELLKDKNIRYIFIGKGGSLDYNYINPNFPLPGWDYCIAWFRNPKFKYSLEKDLEIIHDYIRDRGGLAIYEYGFGEIYLLTDRNISSFSAHKNNLLKNGSFEVWLNGLPLEGWELGYGKISMSGAAADGSYSIQFESGSNNGTSLKRLFTHSSSPPGQGLKLNIQVDIKTGEPDKFTFYINVLKDEKWSRVIPVKLNTAPKGEWLTLSGDFEIPPGVVYYVFNLWLQPGASRPVLVDNCVVIIK